MLTIKLGVECGETFDMPNDAIVMCNELVAYL
jgi:hypothetical protein